MSGSFGLIWHFGLSLGLTLLIYPVFPSCQTGPRSELFGPLSQIRPFRNSRVISIPALLEWCGTHAKLRRGFLLVAPRVRARLPAFPPPRGKMNLTGPGHPRQIASENSSSPVSRALKPRITSLPVPTTPLARTRHPHGHPGGAEALDSLPAATARP